MLSYHFVAVFTFFTFCVSLQLLLFHPFDHLIVMHCYWPHVYLLVLCQNERFCVDVPPVTTLVLDEIADQLFEDYFEMSLDKFSYLFYVTNSLSQILLACAFHSIESFRHFGIDHKFTNLIDFLGRCIRVIRTQNPTLIASISSPTSSHN